MKKLDLNGLGVQEMNAEEMRVTEGGYWQAALALAGACIYVYNEWGDFKAGFKAGWNQA